MIDNRTAGAVVVGAAAVIAAVALTGCGLTASLDESNGHVETVDYATGAAGKSGQDARLPAWVPDQASSVSEAIHTPGSESILRFTLDDPAVLTGCLPSPASHTSATLTAVWWPSGQEAKTDKLCDTDWYVLAQGSTVYAYRPESVVEPTT